MLFPSGAAKTILSHTAKPNKTDNEVEECMVTITILPLEFMEVFPKYSMGSSFRLSQGPEVFKYTGLDLQWLMVSGAK